MGNKRIRIRLEPKKPSEEHMKKLRQGLAAARARAPRKANGKIVTAFKFKNLLSPEGERRLGEVSKTYGGVTSNYRPQFEKDPTLTKRILKLLKNGIPYQTMCGAVGIKVKVFLSWLERGKAGYSRAYIKFYRRVCRAEAAGEITILKNLKKHSSSDWRVSAWQLERIWPEKYGRVDRIRAETRATISVTTDAKKDLGTKVTQDEVARELARRMIDSEARLDFNALPSPEHADA